MSILDIILLICCIPVLINGFKKGFIHQIVSVIALIGGVWAAYKFGGITAEWLKPMLETKCENYQQIANLGGFGITLVATILGIGLIGTLLEKIILFIIPDLINNLLGLLLAVVNATLLCCALLMIFETLNSTFFFTDPKGALFTDSLLYPYLKSITQTILPDIKSLIV